MHPQEFSGFLERQDIAREAIGREAIGREARGGLSVICFHNLSIAVNRLHLGGT
jgi:hypothetical protein